MNWILSFLAALAVGSASAASLYKRALDERKQAYITEGAFYGGVVQKPSSLVNLRRKYAASTDMERLIVDIGDEQLKPRKDPLGSYHVAIERSPSRLVLDFSYIHKSALTEVQMQNIFKASPFVKEVRAVMDPEEHSLNLVLSLKKPVAVEVYEIAKSGEPSRLVIDMKGAK